MYYWYNRWQNDGLDGLRDKPRSGRLRIADEAYRRKLEEVLAQDPQELGFAFSVWTPARLLAYMEQETGVVMHENTLRNLLNEHDYVYRRPKHDLRHLQDKQAKAEAEEMLEMLKKSRTRRNRAFLCGRNDLDPAVCPDQMLDETRLAKAYPCPWPRQMASSHWRLQLAHGPGHLATLPEEELGGLHHL